MYSKIRIDVRFNDPNPGPLSDLPAGIGLKVMIKACKVQYSKCYKDVF
jgi:hypothetical protein